MFLSLNSARCNRIKTWLFIVLLRTFFIHFFSWIVKKWMNINLFKCEKIWRSIKLLNYIVFGTNILLIGGHSNLIFILYLVRFQLYMVIFIDCNFSSWLLCWIFYKYLMYEKFVTKLELFLVIIFWVFYKFRIIIKSRLNIFNFIHLQNNYSSMHIFSV